jgi:hypothetical protein
MEKENEEVHVTPTEASSGAPRQGVRYVLLFSVLLVIILLSAIWIFGALTS